MEYTHTSKHLLLSGTEAVVHLLLTQRRRDRAAGLSTAGFVSGYRGSPLGTLDMALWDAAEQLKAEDIHFTPGVNEDLAATALWGSQYVGQVQGGFPGARVDGVFGLWYGKGPGVDRSGDVLKHGNLAGTSPKGGALVLAGDDHAAKSSTTAHQSEQALIAAGIPVLYPSDVRDIVHLGLHGLALSRESGCWIGLKVVTDVVESAMSIDPSSLGPAANGSVGVAERAVRVQDQPRAAEERLMNEKLPAVLKYASEQGLNRVVLDAPSARRGLLAAGKSYSDLREALQLLGLDEEACVRLGLRLMKLDMVWPLVPQQMEDFSRGLESILVIEEKRALVEDQLKSLLFDLPASASRLQVWGKRQAGAAIGGLGRPLLQSWGELNPVQIAQVIANWLGLEIQNLPATSVLNGVIAPMRLPSFCSGCPHSTSTRVPEGSRALAGIGCHGMATIRQVGVTTTMSQMGGEGAMWIGQAPFTTEPHVFANMGDGTYFHSGLLAIRASVAAGVNLTYKLLVNGFVSMTGGQAIDGDVSVPQMLQSLAAEGVTRIVLVTDDPGKYDGQSLPGHVPVRHRRELDVVQRELRAVPGVSVLVYEQPCATERRRLRKRGEWDDPAVRTFIHPEVCEGCGDCGKASDCLSVEPLETPFGRKRRINQSSCNKDRSCVDGFCPSFITVHGGKYRGATTLKDRTAEGAEGAELPEPVVADTGRGVNVLFAGVGGTGVVTASAVLARAAHLQGLAVTTLDVTGLSQKYGGVQSHVRIAQKDHMLSAARIAPGQTDLLVGCDLLVAAEADVQLRLNPTSARAVLNTGVSPSADFIQNPDWESNALAVNERLNEVCSATTSANATAIAEQLLGDAIGANLMLLGMACQRGWLPVRREMIESVIARQGGAKMNLRAFQIGRRVAHDPVWAERFNAPIAKPIQLVTSQPRTLQQWMDMHSERLNAYQGPRLSQRYASRIQAIADAERVCGHTADRLTIIAARGYYKLLAHKDEFEVARLLTDSQFRNQLEAQFDGPVELHLHLGGGALAKNDPVTGKPVKQEVRGWIWPALKALARLRGLRGTLLDPWRNNAERRLSREWLLCYERDMDLVQEVLKQRPDEATYEQLCALMRVPDRLRGYGHVREQSAVLAAAERDRALAALNAPAKLQPLAA